MEGSGEEQNSSIIESDCFGSYKININDVINTDSEIDSSEMYNQYDEYILSDYTDCSSAEICEEYIIPDINNKKDFYNQEKCIENPIKKSKKSESMDNEKLKKLIRREIENVLSGEKNTGSSFSNKTKSNMSNIREVLENEVDTLLKSWLQKLEEKRKAHPVIVLNKNLTEWLFKKQPVDKNKIKGLKKIKKSKTSSIQETTYLKEQQNGSKNDQDTSCSVANLTSDKTIEVCQNIHYNSPAQSFLVDKEISEKSIKLESKIPVRCTRLVDYTSEAQKSYQDKEEYKNKFEILTNNFEEINKKLNDANLQIAKLQEEVEHFEKNYEKACKERDNAIDQKQIASSSLERREIEVEQLKNNIINLNTFQSEALQAKELNFELREKQLNSEKNLFQQQINDLNMNLNAAKDHAENQNAENLFLKSKITEKDKEMNLLKKIIQDLEILNKENESKLYLSDVKLKAIVRKDTVSMDADIKAQIKLAELYKEQVEIAESRSFELSSVAKELQQLLHEAAQRHCMLEAKIKQKENDSKEILKAKQDAINALEDEIRQTNRVEKQLEDACVQTDKIRKMGSSVRHQARYVIRKIRKYQNLRDYRVSKDVNI